LRGREPEGTVDPHRVLSLRHEVEEFLRSLRDPWTGRLVVREVWPREAIFEGPFVERAPDLLLELHLDRGYSVSLMPSASAPPGTGAWRKLAPHEHIGKKGRSLPGSHRPRGLFIASGESIEPIGEVRAHIADATATLLARLGIGPSAEMSGRILREALRVRSIATELPSAPSPTQLRGDRTSLERRLRALGYID
jgi:predicted AlkP superfamily phosphohydrolase/phosphomutase